METAQHTHVHVEGAPATTGAMNPLTTETTVEEFLERELSRNRKKLARDDDRPETGPLPLVLGVTGHRDLRGQDVDHLEDVLRNEFVRFQTDYPSTPLVLLSALADGADRLAARVALQSGMRLAVVLPMAPNIYETDFDAESRVEFHALMDQAEYLTELPLLPGRTLEDISEHGLPREQQYALAGAYLSMNSALLIAMWDGVELQKVGGTSQVVKFKLEGVPEPYARPRSELDAPDRGPVYHIVTPRASNTETVSRPFGTHRLYPEGFSHHSDANQAFNDICSRMETFNRDSIHYADDLQEHFRQSKEYLFATHARNTMIGGMSAALEEDLDFYAIADVLSQRFQKRTKTALTIMLTFVFFAALFFEMYTEIFEEPAMLGLYLGMFVFSFLCYSWAERNGYQTKYLDYRALAEGLRVQFFWKLAGLDDSAAEFYMRKQRSELDWIRNAIRTCTIEIAHTKSVRALEEIQRERLGLVLKHWVQDQAKYFARAAHRDHEELHGHERTITRLFASALLLAVVQMLFLKDDNHFILLAIGILPVLAAVLHSWLQKNAFAEHKRQYDRMSVFYHRATVHLEKLIAEDRLADARAFLAELGREALAENGDWILLHRDRPLEVPKGA